MSEGKPYDAAEPRDVQVARKNAKQRDLRLKESLRSIMSTPEGRFWMHQMLSTCDVFGHPVSPNDTHMTYFHLGEANIGKKIIADLHAVSTELYLLMMKENQDG